MSVEVEASHYCFVHHSLAFFLFSYSNELIDCILKAFNRISDKIVDRTIHSPNPFRIWDMKSGLL